MTKNPVLKAGAGALAAAALGVTVAACGSSSTAPGIQTVPGGGLTQAQATTTTATTAAAAVATPASGPLSTEPTAAKVAKLPTTLVKKTLVSGSGTAVKSGDTISVNYYGYNAATGKPFSGGSSWTSKTKATPYSVEIGVGEVIKGWDEGLVGVKAGSRVELIIPPKLAYAGTSNPLKSDTLVFVIDVLKVSATSTSTSSSAG